MTAVPYIASSFISGFSSPLGNVQTREKSSVLRADSSPLSVLARRRSPSTTGPAQPWGLFCLTQPAAASMARASNARTGGGGAGGGSRDHDVPAGLSGQVANTRSEAAPGVVAHYGFAQTLAGDEAVAVVRE